MTLDTFQDATYNGAGIESIVHAEQDQWHGVGTKISSDLSAQGILEAAGLDWTVSKRQIYTTDADGNQIKVPGKYALTRDSDNRPFDVVGTHWKENQNRRKERGLKLALELAKG